MMKFITAIVLGCVTFPAVATSFDIDNPNCNPAAHKTVSNDHLTLSFQFCNKIELPNRKREKWSTRYMEAYQRAGLRWLEVLSAVDGIDKHRIDIDVYVIPLADANGMAGPEEEIDVDWRLIPVKGSIFIGSHTYATHFDAVEFEANLLHEMGHVFGVGAYSEDYTRSDGQLGNVFEVKGSQAVKMYNQTFDVDYRVLPMSDDGGHLYDPHWGGDKKRYDKNGRPVPAMTQELMANGNKIGPVTMGLLDDLGYQVNYDQGDRYSK
ncbi:hypothetical protein [Vibrio methylphosphonaticus]|uniref:hypothetical protein n=1 Tax=Vibrio methylphosphonaticus TaxID=2946866 RepID=UPI00202A870F|nr:hypothetical protein [Vibrio methylphosphonaticus]MCL9773201.1 hypothetical protein [Vibrio methylphosphonaticus]